MYKSACQKGGREGYFWTGQSGEECRLGVMVSEQKLGNWKVETKKVY